MENEGWRGNKEPHLTAFNDMSIDFRDKTSFFRFLLQGGGSSRPPTASPSVPRVMPLYYVWANR